MKTVDDVLAHAQTLIARGETGKAAHLLTRVLAQFPDQTDAFLLRAQAHFLGGRPVAALADNLTAYRQRPDVAQVIHNLGVRLHQLGQPTAARGAFILSTALDPRGPSLAPLCHFALTEEIAAGTRAMFRLFALLSVDAPLLWRMPDAATAASSARRDRLGRLCTALHPEEPRSVLTAARLMSPEAAQTLIRTRSDLLLRHPSSLIDAGVLALREHWESLALTLLTEAVVRLPAGEIMSWVYLARAFAASLRHDLALEAIDRAIALEPGRVETLREAAALRLAIGDAARASALFQRAAFVPGATATDISGALTALAYAEDLSDDALFATYETWERRYAQPLYPAKIPATPDPNPDRPLNVGILSSDLYGHPIGVNLLGYFERHDPQGYPLHVYSLGGREDGIRAILRRHTTVWRDLERMDDRGVAEQIRADGIDFLIHTAGHTAQNRPLISAYKPAPLIASYGDFTTTGLKTIDYILTDPVIHPYGTTERLYEHPLRLPLMVIHAPLLGSPDVAPPPADETGTITFASFNNPAKLSDLCLDTWARILAAVPGSRLLVQYKKMFADPAVQSRIFASFDRHGVDRSRLHVEAGDLSRYDHLNLANRADIALDPFPFSGCTSTFEALWMGLPMVTLAGTRWVQRMTASFLVPLGLEDLVATTPSSYLKTAVALAGDPARLRAFRAGLRDRVAASPLLDHAHYARSVEAGIRLAWRRHCAGLPPAPITIST
ncbi:MAG: hypothetical protein NXI16_01640 [Alphaproteobacteria bacterium]|nr:hypothetical protein [Alphaproteobacteria bacterium]